MTATVEQAVNTLYKQVGNEPYKTTASWVNTRTFSLTDMYLMGNKPFTLDTILSNSKDSNGTGTINRAS